MRQVAAHKWAKGLPIEDPAREARVLETAADTGLRFGLTPVSVERLFRIQIDAAKEVQRYWFERWAAGEPVPAAPDLASELRPRIVALGDAMLAAAAGSGAPVAELPRIEGLGAQTAAELAAALAALERFPNRLAQVLESGLLRVGTTGDYAPFSLRREAGGAFEGIDVELAADLAAALGVELRLVQTSWPSLIDDLAAGRFDVAMSGISRTVGRQRVAFFSRPYYVGGKAAISRCADVLRFGSLDAIDQPGVRVIVNPGGTNERFVDARIQRAEKLLHADNRTIFAEIAAGRADVMITDAIEVEMQSRPGTGLCRAVIEPLTYQEKGYLMPQDITLKEFVDLWLTLRLGAGDVAAAFERHGVTWRAP